MYCLSFVLWSWCVAPGTLQPNGMVSESLQEAIQAQHQKYLAALKQGNAKDYANLFTEDGIVLFPGDFQQGRAQLEQRQAQLFAQVRILEGAIHTLSVEQSGPLAYEIGRFQYTVELRADGSRRNLSGRYLAIWKQQVDGSWHMAVDSGFPDP